MTFERRRRTSAGSGLGRHHLVILVGILLAIVAAGTLGYVVLEDWGPGDALYMTVITMTTVGFREVGELDGAGRAWTMLLSLSAVGVIFGTVGIAAEFVVEEVTSGRREEKRMRDRIAALSGHFVLCGYGRVGATVARELVHAGETVVVDLVQESLARTRGDGVHAPRYDASPADDRRFAAGESVIASGNAAAPDEAPSLRLRVWPLTGAAGLGSLRASGGTGKRRVASAA